MLPAGQLARKLGATPNIAQLSAEEVDGVVPELSARTPDLAFASAREAEFVSGRYPFLPSDHLNFLQLFYSPMGEPRGPG